MRVAIFLATVFAVSVSAVASTSSVISPDHHQTFAYGEMIWHQLYLERTGVTWRRGSHLVICLTPVTTNRAGMNRSIFVSRVSGSIQHDAHFL